MQPTAPHTRLQDHVLPPQEWGSPPTRTYSEGGDFWRSISNTETGLHQSRIQELNHKITSTVVSCEGFLMQKVTRGKMLTWQQRYMMLNPNTLTLTFWEIAPGQVIVSRPTEPGTTIPFTSVANVNACVGKNKTRFDIVMQNTKSTTDTTPSSLLLSMMADTPEDCKRWCSALNMVVAAMQADGRTENSESSSHVNNRERENELDNDKESPWELVTRSVSLAIEKDPSLRGTILYGLPAFFSAIDRDGMGLVSLHEFEQGMLRLGLNLSRESIDDLNITSGTGKNALVAYREVVERLNRVALEDGETPLLNREASPARVSSKRISNNSNISEISNNISTKASKTASKTSSSLLSTSASLQSPSKKKKGTKKTSSNSSNTSPIRKSKRSTTERAERDSNKEVVHKKGTTGRPGKRRVSTKNKVGKFKNGKSNSQPPTVVRQRRRNKNGLKNGLKNRNNTSFNRNDSTVPEKVHYISVPMVSVQQVQQKQLEQLEQSEQSEQLEQQEKETNISVSSSSSSLSSSKTSNRRGGGRTTSYSRPWAIKPSKRNRKNTTANTPSFMNTNTSIDFNRVHILSLGNHSNPTTTTTTTSTASVTSAALKVEADRKEKHALHSALTSAQQMIATETRSRQKAEKLLTREKKREAISIRKMLTGK